jgi:inner membrane protein
VPRRAWAIAIAAAILPDADAIGFWLGVPYDSVFGHRGITHSLAFAAAFAAVLAWSLRQRRLWLFFFLAIASHGILDAFTNGGMGVAFFAPFSKVRYFFPVTPIEVSPISVTRFISWRGLRILASEAQWVWLPAFALGGAGLYFSRRRRLWPAHG